VIVPLLLAILLQAPNPCRDFDAVYAQIRDQTIDRAAAAARVRDLLPRIHAYAGQHGGGGSEPWRFPLEGYGAESIGGTDGSGYRPDGYDWFDGRNSKGHPGHDLFIRDRNQDSLDDRTGRPVTVLSIAAGVVVATAPNWDPESGLRGGRYVYVYSPAEHGFFYYAHNASLLVKPGDVVRAGTPIATVGRSGRNAAMKRSPTHLHVMFLAVGDDGAPRPRDIYADLVRSASRRSVRVARIRRVEPILVAQAFTACRGDSMRVLSCVVLAIGVAAAQSFAQASFLPIVDHIHLNVPDQAAAVAWYQKNFGGQPMTEAPDRVMLGDTRLIFLKKADAQPSSGSALDHIGFSFADVDAKVKELEAAGVKVVTPVRDVQGLFKLGFVEDPWGTRIELVQDAEKLGLHHVHLRGPDPAAVLAFYKDKFGGETGKLKDRIDGVRYGGVWLLAQRGDAVPSEGHAIDHFGFRTTNLDGAAKAFKAENVKFTTEPRPLKLASGTIVNYAYIEGPAGAKVELVQR